MVNPFATRAKTKGSPFPSSPLERRLITTVESDDSGNLRNVSKVQMVDPNDELKDLKFMDFSLTNLALSGSLSGLSKIGPLQSSKLNSADRLNGSLSSLQSDIDALNASKLSISDFDVKPSNSDSNE